MIHLVDAVPDAEGEPRPDEETEELADSHDAGHLPERSSEQTVTDDDDVAQDGERRPQGEPQSLASQECTHPLQAFRVGTSPPQHLFVGAEAPQEIVDNGPQPVTRRGHQHTRPQRKAHHEQSTQHHLRVHREGGTGQKRRHE